MAKPLNEQERREVEAYRAERAAQRDRDVLNQARAKRFVRSPWLFAFKLILFILAVPVAVMLGILKGLFDKK